MSVASSSSSGEVVQPNSRQANSIRVGAMRTFALFVTGALGFSTLSTHLFQEVLSVGLYLPELIWVGGVVVLKAPRDKGRAPGRYGGGAQEG